MGRQFQNPDLPAPPKRRGPVFWITRALQVAMGGAFLWFVVVVVIPEVLCAAIVAKRTQGISTVKQIGTDLNLYLVDNNDCFPPANRWEDLARSLAEDPSVFLSQNLRCPSIAFNRNLSSVNSVTIELPSETPLVFESSLLGHNAAGGPGDVYRSEFDDFFVSATDTTTKAVKTASAADRPWSPVTPKTDVDWNWDLR
jgi:hypothetical protein